ncbi:MAG: hypothetical protein QXR62_03675 [Candidatus Bathyarchaeia archaeon]
MPVEELPKSTIYEIADVIFAAVILTILATLLVPKIMSVDVGRSPPESLYYHGISTVIVASKYSSAAASFFQMEMGHDADLPTDFIETSMSVEYTFFNGEASELCLGESDMKIIRKLVGIMMPGGKDISLCILAHRA